MPMSRIAHWSQQPIAFPPGSQQLWELKKAAAIETLLRNYSLGRVDGFDKDEGESESDEGAIVLDCLLAAERDALEALQPAHGLLDAHSTSIKHLREEGWPVLGVALVRNDRTDPAR